MGKQISLFIFLFYLTIPLFGQKIKKNNCYLENAITSGVHMYLTSKKGMLSEYELIEIQIVELSAIKGDFSINRIRHKYDYTPKPSHYLKVDNNIFIIRADSVLYQYLSKCDVFIMNDSVNKIAYNSLEPEHFITTGQPSSMGVVSFRKNKIKYSFHPPWEIDQKYWPKRWFY
jgi:hypothetical protein